MVFDTRRQQFHTDALLYLLIHSVEATNVMASKDWRRPFLQLRDKFRSRFDDGEQLFHEILMSPFYEVTELREVVENQAAAYSKEPLAATIETPTEGCKYHAQYFYGDKTVFRQINRDLRGIDDWLLGIPKGLLRRFSLARKRTGTSENLIAWTNLVYFLAWEIDAPYLRAEVYFQSRIHDLTAVPWDTNLWPKSCDPRPLLIQQANGNGQLERFLEAFSEPEEGPWCPDIIGAHLLGEPFCADFVCASIAAIDVLVFMFEQLCGQRTSETTDNPSSINKRPKNHKQVKKEVELLKAFLVQRHVLEKVDVPMTAVQIAGAMEWYSESGRPLQEKASRRMAEIFGTNAMDKYRKKFIDGDLKKGFRPLLQGGGYGIEAIADSAEEEDSIEMEFD